jgi:hypothetical protein
LTVRDQTSLDERWSEELSGSITGVSEMALDAYRPAAGGAKNCGKPLGTLYVMTKTGSTATLRAILVDSKGLDGTAPWPKYQKDNANTGNSGSSLADWTCP